MMKGIGTQYEIKRIAVKFQVMGVPCHKMKRFCFIADACPAYHFRRKIHAREYYSVPAFFKCILQSPARAAAYIQETGARSGIHNVDDSFLKNPEIIESLLV